MAEENVPSGSNGVEHLSLHAQQLELDELHKFDYSTEYAEQDIGDTGYLSEGDYIAANGNTFHETPLEGKIAELDGEEEEEDNGAWKPKGSWKPPKAHTQVEPLSDLDVELSDGERSPSVSEGFPSGMDEPIPPKKSPKPVPKKPPTEQLLHDLGLTDKKKAKKKKKKSKAVTSFSIQLM
jgi:hypothetical protein